MDVFAKGFEYIVDDTKKISHKALAVIAFLLALFLVDDTLSFSYYHSIGSKVTLVSQLNKTLTDTSLTKTERTELLTLRKDAIEHSSLQHRTFEFITNLNGLPLNEKTNPILQYITASALILFMEFGIIYVGGQALYKSLTSPKRSLLDDNAIIIIVKVTGAVSLCFVLSILCTRLLSMIPLVFNNAIFNYIINLFINSLALLLIGYISKMKEKRKNKAVAT